jgi:hypothetical protein
MHSPAINLKMKYMRYASTFIFALISMPSFSHQDFIHWKTIGNVTVRIKTGYSYEEINKVFVFGVLADSLLNKLKYKGTVYLDFQHNYTSKADPVYFLSYDKGTIKYTWSEEHEENNPMKKNGIVIRQLAHTFNALETLKLIDYSINNSPSIKAEQKEMRYEHNYRQWLINTIDTTHIRNILKLPASEEVLKAMTIKVNRNEKKASYGLSYYYSEGKYTFTLAQSDTDIIELFDTENVYQIHEFNDYSMIAFDTDSSFYFIKKYLDPQVSKQHVITNRGDNYRPYSLHHIGGDLISLYFYYRSDTKPFKHVQRILIYDRSKDILIQDLMEILE